jgi:hypothetical protein
MTITNTELARLHAVAEEKHNRIIEEAEKRETYRFATFVCLALLIALLAYVIR